MKLIKLLLVVGVIYVAWVYGRPWFQEQIVGAGERVASGARDDEGACLTATRRALDELRGELDDLLAEGRDGEKAEEDAYRTIELAEGPCGCSTPACEKAKEAQSEMRSAVQRLRRRASQRGGFGDPSLELEAAADRFEEAQGVAIRI